MANNGSFQPTTIIVENTRGIYRILIASIMYIYSADGICDIILNNGRKLTVHNPMSHFQASLGQLGFISIRRGVLANLSYICSLSKGNDKTITLSGGKRLTVSERMYKQVKDAIKNSQGILLLTQNMIGESPYEEYYSQIKR